MRSVLWGDSCMTLRCPVNVKRASKQNRDPGQPARAKALSTRGRKIKWDGLGRCPCARAGAGGDMTQCRL